MNIRLLVVLLTGYFLLLVTNIFGQGFCGSTGGFTIIPSEGCAPLKIAVKNQVLKAENVSYVYNFNRQQITFPDKKDITPDSFYVYQNPGTFTIFQVGSSGGTGFSLCKDVVVYETRAPKAEVVTCQNGRVRLTLKEDSIAKAYDQIEINWGDSTPAVIWKKGESLTIDHKYSANSKIPSIVIRGKYAAGLCNSELNTTTLSNFSAPTSLSGIKINSVKMTADGKAELSYQGIEGVPTEIFVDKGNGQFITTGNTGSSGSTHLVIIDNLDKDQIYRFKLISKDFCDNLIESEVVSSMKVKEGKLALDEINSLIWEHYPYPEKVKEYQLVRDGKVIFTTPDQLSYLDSDVKCGGNYLYELVVVLNNNVESHSAPITITPKSSSPEIIKKASVTVEEDNLITSEVELSGEGLTSSYDLMVERTNSGSADWQIISGPDNASLRYEDRNVNTSENSYCYRFSYKNACNLSSPAFSEPVCSILLTSNGKDLLWNSESPFSGAVASYDLIQINTEGKVTDELPKQQDHSHTLDLDTQSSFSFKIRAHSSVGNLLSYSNVMTLARNAILLIPDAFTPNGDGINDTFVVKNYFNTSFNISIYSRWGEMVFHADNAEESWDGNIKGKPAPAGYYVFKLNTTDIFKKSFFRNGSFLLIR